jgi:hypothetical protein
MDFLEESQFEGLSLEGNGYLYSKIYTG